MHPRIVLKDDRELVYERNAARRALKHFRVGDITSVGDKKFLEKSTDTEDFQPLGVDDGIDFSYVDGQRRRIYVQIKRLNSKSSKIRLKKELDHFRTKDRPIELWKVTNDAASLIISSGNSVETTYGLVDVVVIDRHDGKVMRIDSARIEKQVDVWRSKIEQLFDQLTIWGTEAGYLTNRSIKLHASEEMMERFGVAPVELPILKIFKGGHLAASVMPVGLWVIGALGRLDLFTPKTGAMIINTSGDLSDPKWSVFHRSTKTSIPLTQKVFMSLMVAQ